MLVRFLNVAIVAFWLAMMFSLVKDKILPRASAIRTTVVDVPELVLEWEDVDETFEIVNEGLRLGATHLSILASSQPVGYKVDFGFALKLMVLQKNLKIVARGEAQLDHLFYLERFTVDLSALSVNLHAGGAMDEQKRLFLKIVPEGAEPVRAVVQFDNYLSFLEAVRPIALKRLELQVGQSYSIDVLDPIGVMRRGELVLTVEKRDILVYDDPDRAPIEVFVVNSSFAGMETALWIDMQGNVVRRQLLPHRDIYLERIDPADQDRRGPRGTADDLERPIEPLPIDPAEFADIQPTTMDELYRDYADRGVFAGIFKSLNNIVPETQK